MSNKDNNESNTHEIVITGMSGLFPNSHNIKEFEYNLYNKINMMDDKETRWPHTRPDIPRVIGKIPQVNKFDATFFGVHHSQAEKMDSQMRLILEESYKAVMDAGVNPSSLRNSKTGVYVGVCFSESDRQLIYDETAENGFGILGASRSLIPNRISFAMGLNGPSMVCDTACSSTMYALNLAYEHMISGKISAAIVGGVNLFNSPHITLQFAKLGILSISGTSRPFDENANGYVRSEAISCIFLQRRQDAKRIYATLVHSAVNCDGFKPEGLTFPSGAVQMQLISNFYDEIKVDLNDLGFIEAHGTGTVVGDPEECRAIDETICKKRQRPLLVGSVKSNCGHTEAASGITSIIKVLLTMHNNCIPPNINFSKPRKEITAIKEGRLVVVTEKTELTKPYVAMNSFGFGGANAHVLLKQFNEKLTSTNATSLNLPYLMTWSSRTEENINALFDQIESRPLNMEHLALLRSAQAGGIQGMMYRGFSILKPIDDSSLSKPVVLSRVVQHNDGIKYPIVWVLSGMGSQWVGMGKDLMKIKVCAESLLRSHSVLKAHGLDLIKVLTSDDPDSFQNVIHSFTGITATQIAIIDLLRMLKITPDFIIGHSLGETACAYADGSLTAEQTIMSSYYRGKISRDMQRTRGAMAAIGLGFKDIQAILPPNIEVACHNSADSCTISGPDVDVNDFIQDLKTKNIFAKEVPCSNIAYHSSYISHLGPELKKYLKQLIPNPKLRSNKWISTSVPADRWLENDCKYSSAEYQINNLISSVLFEESSAYLPKNTLTIEIAPHALLQSIIRNAMPDGIHTALLRRNIKDNVLHLFEALGSLYSNGVELSLESLYPPIEFPVSRSTPTISDLIEFDHSVDHNVPRYVDDCMENGIKRYKLKTNSDHKFLFGHKIDGRPLVPATFYLECVWRTFATMNGITEFDKMDVEFENVRFVRATTLSAKDQIEFLVIVQRGTGDFEITESKNLIANGTIRALTGQSQPSKMFSDVCSEEITQLAKRDFYKELKLRGFHYEGDFQSVELATSDGSYGKVKWFNNWVTFLDCMLQMIILAKDSRSLVLPIKLRSMRIFSNYQKKIYSNECEIEVFANASQKRLVGGGVEIVDLTASHVQRRRPPGDAVLERYQFVPYMPAQRLSVNDISRCCLQLLLENQTITKCSIVEVVKSADYAYLNSLMQAMDGLPTIQGSFTALHLNATKAMCDAPEESTNITHINSAEDLESNVNILVIDLSEFQTKLVALQPKLSATAMILIKSDKSNNSGLADLPKYYHRIAYFPCEQDRYSLMALAPSSIDESADSGQEIFIKISESDKDFQWIDNLKSAIGKRIVLVSENETYNGLIGLVNCLRKEPETENVRCILINDLKAPAFSPTLPFYRNQLELGLAINVYRKGQWGCYRHLELKPSYPIIKHEDYIRGAIDHVGDFSTLHWQQGPLAKDKPKIRVAYSALNFRDVMHASGRLSLDDVGISRLDQFSIFGLEYSGYNIETGRPTMGMILCSAIASHIEKQPLISFDVPSSWSLREAATVPVVYITVYFAFFYTADIRTGKSILIHSGSGGVGIAAIRTAIAYGLEVFTTVSTPEKKAFLLKTFPKLKEQNIGNSRDCSFETMIEKRTKGRGVDFVLNSLSEDKLKASLRCLAPKGHFLEIGKFDMANDSNIGLGVFFQGQSFHAVLADKLGEYGPELMKKIKDHMNLDIEKGIIQPLPTTIFKPAELEQAFRYLMTAKHIGKVLIEMRDDVKSPVTHPISVVPKIYFDKELVYVMPGGLGGFGLELVDWMVLRGARKIVLNSRRGISEDYQNHRILLWKSYGCETIINTSDITTEKGCLDLLTAAMKLGPIGGIFNLAVLLKDGIFSNQTNTTFQQSLAPKAIATKYLDKLSRKLCPKLHCFVVFSSVSCGRGNAGQTNYGMANSIMERIIEERVAAGLPGKAIQWGAVGEVGLVAAMAEGKIDLNIGGTLQQRISSCLDVLDTLMTSPDPIVSSMVVAEKKIAAEGQTALQYVMNTLSITDLKSVSLGTTLSELGMDSLMGVEIKQALERNYDIVLSPAELRSLSIDRLKELSETHKTKVTVDNNVDKEEENEDFTEALHKLYGNIKFQFSHQESLYSINKVDLKKIPIIVLPGIEGISTEVWTTIGKSLKVPTYVLQFLINFQARNFNELVEASVSNILKLLECHHTKTFRIVAYSFGTLLGHVTTKRLESLGYNGSCIYIDGSPMWLDTVGSSLRKLKSAFEIEKRSIMILLSFLLSKKSYNEVQKNVNTKDNREILFTYIRQILESDNHENTSEIIQYMNALLYVTEMTVDTETYKAVDIIQSKILLIKPTELVFQNMDKYYGLKPITRNVIDDVTIDGNHQTILQNQQIPSLINKYFEI